MIRRVAIASAVIAVASVAVAGPDRSLRPVERPSLGQPADALPESFTVAKVPLALPATRPLPRPPSEQMIAAAARVDTDPVFSPESSLRPVFRPDDFVQKALFGKRKKKKGSVCGDIDIQGEKVGNYGKGGGCFIPDAVRVKSVSGVKLSQSALMTCDTAKALNTWVKKGVQPAFKKNVTELKVAAHYACRTRNNQKGAKLSEHGKGRAIDISAFRLRNGQEITLLQGWGSRQYGSALRRMHKGACGPFGTVLGPEANRFHRDHFHFDTARYRSGAYCR